MNRSLFLVVFLFLFLPFANADLTIGAPETVSERRIGRTIFEYTMRAKITHPGPAAPRPSVPWSPAVRPTPPSSKAR